MWTCPGSRADCSERPASFWIHVDVDAIKDKTPMWGFPSDLRIQADSSIVLARCWRRCAKGRRRISRGGAQRMKRSGARSEARNAVIAAKRRKQGRARADRRQLSSRATLGTRASRPGPSSSTRASERPGDFQPADADTVPARSSAFRAARSAPPAAPRWAQSRAARRASRCSSSATARFYQLHAGDGVRGFAALRAADLTVVIDNAGWAAVKDIHRAHVSGRRSGRRRRR